LGKNERTVSIPPHLRRRQTRLQVGVRQLLLVCNVYPRLQQILDDKAYIDTPNMDFLVYLNPRAIFYGLKVSFEL
jgi:hypothetical protein